MKRRKLNQAQIPAKPVHKHTTSRHCHLSGLFTLNTFIACQRPNPPNLCMKHVRHHSNPGHSSQGQIRATCLAERLPNSFKPSPARTRSCKSGLDSSSSAAPLPFPCLSTSWYWSFGRACQHAKHQKSVGNRENDDDLIIYRASQRSLLSILYFPFSQYLFDLNEKCPLLFPFSISPLGTNFPMSSSLFRLFWITRHCSIVGAKTSHMYKSALRANFLPCAAFAA